MSEKHQAADPEWPDKNHAEHSEEVLEGWRCGSSGRAPASELKPLYRQEKKKILKRCLEA
jgi:hypothetical protein